jgi:hypothetical protein
LLGILVVLVSLSVTMSSQYPYRYKETIDDYNGTSREDEEAHEKLTAPPDFSGPTTHRYCTDVLCLFFLFMAWVVMTGLGVYAVYNGDYRLVLYPLDYQGNICGTDYEGVNMTDYPFLLYVNFFTGGVCVHECPSLQDGGASTADGLTDMQTLVTYGGIFQGPDAQLSADFVQIAPHYEANDTNDTQNYQCTIETCLGTTDTNSTDPAESWSSPGINEGYGFAYYIGDTFPLFQRCYLTQEVRKLSSQRKHVQEHLKSN